MKNVLTFTKNNEHILSTQLEQLEENLNNSVADINYSLFVIDKIAAEYTNQKITRTAEEFRGKQTLAQDELDYLNSCINFLKRQLDKAPSSHTMTRVEISEKVNRLTTDIDAFIEIQIGEQNAYFLFANEYFHAIARAA